MQFKLNTRRTFLKKTGMVGALTSLGLLSNTSSRSISPTQEGPYLIGTRKGYAPQIGILLSTMTMMRTMVVRVIKDLTIEELDFQLDEQSNSIGAMLLHLAATERYYQLNTFEGIPWGEWEAAVKKEWDVAMGLGKQARKEIKGKPIDFYLNKLKEVREKTKEGFAQRSDDWLWESEPFFGNKPTNNYAKWFHVCEHESNHNGQIKLIKKRFNG